MQNILPPPPNGATGALVLADDTVFWGHGIGALGSTIGEVCFNTSMTGYQEVITDPSYAGQIITFTFPHIGNVGVNDIDTESARPVARGVVFKTDVTPSSNWRATEELCSWLAARNIIGVTGINTRHLTEKLREQGAINGAIFHVKDGAWNIEEQRRKLQEWQGLEGLDLAREVTCDKPYQWETTVQDLTRNAPSFGKVVHVVAIDYGAKHNILRCLVRSGCRVTVVPATTTAEAIINLQPDGIFLSNGPGDPAATAVYAVPVLRALLARNLPIFGICLGHQLLALALGGRTRKMSLGHRGANHPVKDLNTGQIEITSQNHGFCVIPESLPAEAEVTHISLFDGTNEGLRLKDRPVFSVQYHPEASPGPHDSHVLFDIFVTNIRQSMRG